MKILTISQLGLLLAMRIKPKKSVYEISSPKIKIPSLNAKILYPMKKTLDLLKDPTTIEELHRFDATTETERVKSTVSFYKLLDKVREGTMDESNVLKKLKCLVVAKQGLTELPHLFNKYDASKLLEATQNFLYNHHRMFNDLKQKTLNEIIKTDEKDLKDKIHTIIESLKKNKILVYDLPHLETTNQLDFLTAAFQEFGKTENIKFSKTELVKKMGQAMEAIYDEQIKGFGDLYYSDKD